MILHSYVPGPSLGDFVEQFRRCSVEAALFRAQVLPQGTIAFVVNHGEDEIRGEDRDPMHADAAGDTPGQLSAWPTAAPP